METVAEPDPGAARLAATMRRRRAERGLTLNEFAAQSGVSRAMISKIERGEASPTAVILARLAAGLGVSLASLFSDDEAEPRPLARLADQPVWTDPASGYVRRNVSPPQAGADIVEVRFPAGGRVMFDNGGASARWRQQIWVLEGTLELTYGAELHRLESGDCMTMALDRPLVFHNPGASTVRYAVILNRPD